MYSILTLFKIFLVCNTHLAKPKIKNSRFLFFFVLVLNKGPDGGLDRVQMGAYMGSRWGSKWGPTWGPDGGPNGGLHGVQMGVQMGSRWGSRWGSKLGQNMGPNGGSRFCILPCHHTRDSLVFN